MVLWLTTCFGVAQIFIYNSERPQDHWKYQQSPGHIAITGVIVFLNIAYLIFWLYKVWQATVRHLSYRDECTCVVLMLTCGCFKTTEEIKKERNEIQNELKNEEVLDKDMKRIDMVI